MCVGISGLSTTEGLLLLIDLWLLLITIPD
jgi:hypothetical protein